MISCLFFDGDDTLWDNASNYERAHQEFIILCESLGFDRGRCDELVIRKDKKLIEENRFGHRWYKRVLVETYRELAGVEEGREEGSVLKSIGEIIHRNFSGKVTLYPNVEEILRSIASPERRLFLFTVGDAEIQGRKIFSTGVSNLFEAAFIGNSKTMEDYRALLEFLKLSPEQCVMFGDSFYRDVLPAIEAEMKGVLIRNPKTWSYENLTDDLIKEIPVLEALEKVPDYIDQNGL